MQTSKVISTAVLTAILLAGWPATAQPSGPPQEPRQVEPRISDVLAQQTQQQGSKPSKGAFLDQSLEVLLNNGHVIVSASPMATGSAFTLRDANGGKWVYCTVARQGGTGPQQGLTSQCTALN